MKVSIYNEQQPHTLLFLHGGGVGGWMWKKQLAHFSDYKCAVAELEFGTADASIERLANQLLHWVELNTGQGKVALIGFSIGAQIALRMVSKRPELFCFSMLNSPLTIPSTLPKSIIRNAVRCTHPLIKNRSFSALQARALAIPAEDFETYYQQSLQISYLALTKMLEENMQFSIPSEFPNTKTNVLVTVGEKEKSIMKRSAAKLADCHPFCKSLLIANSRHGFPLEHPQLFNLLLRKELAGSPF
ncbi:Pimeloyl-ACP methyl ester carboxylesterase [Terribacillus halophilus]|uniref:Pimeloyl-ACP methyl ester carboxylesterase n=1 Tax=Terribacillus halophilus TaxID=361279 RepID=A0A1G6IWA6_9BACI|nr:alpha/beta hydrolase [Terribacillus halophilus]SDC10036.1 Pimeloyl-ACP methyl ester carboxylesterase [Terribacillus halophilus]